MALDCSKPELNRIELRTVGREEENVNASLLAELLDSITSVNGCIVTYQNRILSGVRVHARNLGKEA